jgi:hypothetical protein
MGHDGTTKVGELGDTTGPASPVTAVAAMDRV